MKTFIRRSVLVAFGALALTRLGAALESVKIETTYVPSLSPGLLARGITEGEVNLVIAVSAEGKLTDWLVLSSTDRELENYLVAALQEWTITPARLDGRPIGVQLQLHATISAQGVVLSRTASEMNDTFFRQLRGNPMKHFQVSADKLDRVPVRLNTVGPRYAREAEQQGVRGKVQVNFYIDAQGDVRMPAVRPGAQPYLAEQAVEAVRAWKFTPPTRRGEPVLVAASQEFDFSSGQ